MNVTRATGIAVLGYGRIGRIHADNVRREPSARLVVVADPAFASGGSAPDDCAWTADVDSVFSHPEVDAVLICTPTPTHARFLELAAAAKKDVFCEKPIDLDPVVAARAVAAVERAGVKLQVGFNRRFDPSFRAVRDAIAAGEIGTLSMLRVISRDPSPPPPEYVASSGGLFLDMTIHDFDMVRFLSGREVVEAQAFAAVRVDPRIGEAGDVDTALLSLKLDTGALALVDNSRRAVYGYDQRVAAFGSDGAIEAGNRNADSTVFSGPGGVRKAKPLDFFTERYEAAYRDELVAFLGALRDGSAIECDGRAALAPLAIGLAANRSLASGKPEPVIPIDRLEPVSPIPA
jgi:myo-inositol 2-dehydrogenase/D-chiro-inositol 1-dehydrogenase